MNAADVLAEILDALPRCQHGEGADPAHEPWCGALASHRVDQQWHVCPAHHALITSRPTRGTLEPLPWFRAAKRAMRGEW